MTGTPRESGDRPAEGLPVAGGGSPWQDRIFATAFLAVVSLPTLGVLTAPGDFLVVQGERRRAAPFPTIELQRHESVELPTRKSLEAFPQGFERWFDDRIAFRGRFVAAVRDAKRHGLFFDAPLADPTEKAGVVVGRDGWLFYRGDRTLECYACTSPLRDEQLDRWTRTFRERRDRLAREGILYLVVFVPNKETVYSEFLPDWVEKVGPQSRIDQLVDRFSAPDGISFVDLRAPLVRAKDRAATYHRTDTHWTSWGGFVGYREIMLALGTRLPEARPAPVEDFDLVVEPGLVGYSDLVDLLGETLVPDDVVRLVPRRPRAVRTGPCSDERGVLEKCVRTTCDGAPLAGLMLYGDSFLEELRPFFAQDARRAMFLQRPSDVPVRPFPIDLILEERPLAFVDVVLERSLMVEGPTNDPEYADPRPAPSK